ncbi:MAG: hypothetical protein KDD94_08420 [Calditrichaeota bacterium]|nr:hypothetical protein [Calditrichota bacterium]
MKRIGVIDVGTNSVLALALDQSQTILFNDYQISEFGKGLSQNNFELRPERIEATFRIVSDFITEFRRLNIDQISVVGTSASRDAKNIHRFANRLLDNFQLDYRILSGDDEARLTYLGALSQFENLDQQFLMMDIGGGSTEIINGLADQIRFQHSFNMGSVRFFDRFQNPDSLSEADIDKLDRLIITEFESIPINSKTDCFVGIGGTFTTAASVIHELTEYQPEKISGAAISYTELDELWAYLNSLPNSERELVIGMEKKRSPIILYGMRIYLKFMELHKIDEVIISDRGLRFGVAFEYFSEGR